jgi:hypothetical protein
MPVRSLPSIGHCTEPQIGSKYVGALPLFSRAYQNNQQTHYHIPIQKLNAKTAAVLSLKKAQHQRLKEEKNAKSTNAA